MVLVLTAEGTLNTFFAKTELSKFLHITFLYPTHCSRTADPVIYWRTPTKISFWMSTLVSRDEQCAEAVSLHSCCVNSASPRQTSLLWQCATFLSCPWHAGKSSCLQHACAWVDSSRVSVLSLSTYLQFLCQKMQLSLSYLRFALESAHCSPALLLFTVGDRLTGCQT